MIKISNFLKCQKGAVAVLFAAAIVALVGFMALSIDVGYMVTAKNQLQAAVDAATLAGASAMLTSQADATNRAIYFAGLNNCMKEPVVLTMSDITFPTSNRIHVQGHRIVNLNFAPAIGISTANIIAEATAEIGQLVGTGELKPWAIPDLDYPIGSPVTLKAGELGAPGTSSGFFYPVDYPPINRGTPEVGASVYEEKIVDGAGCDVYIGDILQVEPGNQIGPTAQGVKSIVDLDPEAYWDGNQVVSDFGEKSPRIVKVPFFDPNTPPDSGRNTVSVIGLGAFFVLGINGKNVQGVFIEITTSGQDASSNVNSMLYGVKLIQ